jgi:GT2 family glycosyltransferase
MTNIAVLITCYNRRDKTLACLQALFASELPGGVTLQVFLVDDGCTDGTADAVNAAYPAVKIIKGDGNLFWNRGMHLAWQIATREKDYDYYLWLNDDTYLIQKAIEVMLSAAESTESKAIIVAACCSKINGELTYSGFLLNGQAARPSDELMQTDMFNGNCVLIPKFVYQKVGNLELLFHHSIGDFDYGLRAIKQGIKSFIAPGFLAYCESHEAPLQWCMASVPLNKRITSLYSPLGNSHPYYFFRFELRHFGLLTALKHLFSIHLRLLIPSLWKS